MARGQEQLAQLEEREVALRQLEVFYSVSTCAVVLLRCVHRQI